MSSSERRTDAFSSLGVPPKSPQVLVMTKADLPSPTRSISDTACSARAVANQHREILDIDANFNTNENRVPRLRTTLPRWYHHDDSLDACIQPIHRPYRPL